MSIKVSLNLTRSKAAAHFLFVSIPQQRLAENDCFDTRLSYRYTLNTVGRDSAFYERMFAQNLEQLRRLFWKQVLLATSFAEIS